MQDLQSKDFIWSKVGIRLLRNIDCLILAQFAWKLWRVKSHSSGLPHWQVPTACSLAGLRAEWLKTFLRSLCWLYVTVKLSGLTSFQFQGPWNYGRSTSYSACKLGTQHFEGLFFWSPAWVLGSLILLMNFWPGWVQSACIRYREGITRSCGWMLK